MATSNPIAPPRIDAKTRQGRCYELAGKGIQRDPSWLLVHGRIYRALTDTWIDHAWLIKGDQTYDPVLDRTVPSAVAARRIIDRTYGIEQALEHMLQAGHWGPWHDRADGEG